MDIRKPWYELWFDSPYYPLLYRKRDNEEAKAFIDALLDRLSVPDGARILDLACGRGRHAAYFADKGFQVTGLDISTRSIEEAKSRYQAPNLEFYIHDMRDYFRINYFDFIFNFFTSFGYFDNPNDNRSVIRAMYAGLKPGGRVMIDFMNTEKVVNDLVEREKTEAEGITFDIRRVVENGYIRKHIYFEVEGKKYAFTESVQALLPHHFHTWLNEFGFRLLDEYGDYQLRDFDAKWSPRYIVVAEKP